MYAVRVRFVRDSKGPLEDKPKRVTVTIARNHEEAMQRTVAHFFEIARVGVEIEYGEPMQLSDTIALESLVYSGE